MHEPRPALDQRDDWDDFLFVDPGDTFAPEVDEEPWYWGVLDEEPPDYCPPCSPVRGHDHEEQAAAAEALFQGRDEGEPLWRPYDFDVPEGYVDDSHGASWSDKQLGPILGRPTHLWRRLDGQR